MQCPKCRLENPPTAQRCDCGYDFESGQMKASYLTKSDPKAGKRKPSTWLVVSGWIFAFLGGLIGIFIARHIAYGKDKSDLSRRAYAYDDASRSRGKVMMWFAIVMLVVYTVARTTPPHTR